MFNIKLQKSSFVKALSHVQSVVEKRNVATILSHLKLETSGNTLTLTAIDNTLSITETIEIESSNDMAITLPAQTLYDIVRKLPENTVELKIDQDQSSMLEISSGFSVFHIPFLSIDDFPKIDIGNFECQFSMPHNVMQKIIEKNKNTIIQEDARHNFNGIYLHCILDNNEIRGTATDGHRLSSVRVIMPEGSESMNPVIVPRKTIFELAKIMQDHNDDLRIELSKVKIKFTIGNVIVISKLIDSEFPDYLSLIPYSNSLYFEVLVNDLSKAIDRVTTIVIDKSKAITLQITKNELEVSLGGDHQSMAKEKLEVNSNIDEFIVSINSRYMLDALSSMNESAMVKFKFSDPYSAILAASDDDDKTDFVLMPMRT